MLQITKRLPLMMGALVAAGTLSTAAFAQDNSFVQGDSSVTIDVENAVIKDSALEETVKKGFSRDTGLYPKLHIGGSAQMGYNKDVDGVDDGINFTFGLLLSGALDLVKNFGNSGALEWQNALIIEDQMSKTPTIDSFIKSKDKLDFQSTVLYRIPKVEWLGPFLRFQLTTSIFPGSYISATPVTVRFYQEDTAIDGKADTKLIKTQEIDAQESIKLASAGIPLTLKESVGLFMDPYQSVPFSASFKVGVAGQELYADGDSYTAFDDDDSDAYYDVRYLGDSWTTSVGVEGSLNFKGVLVDCFNWELYGRIYYPFEGNFDKEKYDEVDRIHAEVMAKISVKISDWGSFDYSLEIKRDPFVTLDWQITNNILFTVGFDPWKGEKVAID
ncbi:MAG: hypothetical protein IKY83_02185 [Proteobacteria bacterium]|nr:hypothetical protein [Pseudomonadota bacterium]